jgi:hypothetical protein
MIFKEGVMVDFLYHLTNVFTNCYNIDQLVFKLLEVTLVLVRKKYKVPIVEKSSSQEFKYQLVNIH